MPVPAFDPIDFANTDDPYAGGAGYVEKLDQLSANFTALCNYNAAVELTTEQVSAAMVAETEEDRLQAAASAASALADRLLAQNAAQNASSIAFQSGSVTTDGSFGVTITHDKGDLNYTPKATIIGTAAQAMKAGEISFVMAANTVVVYNTGDPVTIQYELSGVAP